MKRVAAALLLVLGSACTSAPKRDEILVFAAASLMESFGEIATAFEHAHTGVVVRFNFGPSDGLANQIIEGAAADVYATAAPRWIGEILKTRAISFRAPFARNRLVVIVPSSNPAHIASVADLGRRGVKLVLAAAGVPAGEYARQMLANAGIRDAALRNVVSNEEDVKGVVQKVLLGEADAGVAYATDVTKAVRDRVRAIEVPGSVNVTATYVIVAMETSKHPSAAQAFAKYVAGPGRDILIRAGFLPP